MTIRFNYRKNTIEYFVKGCLIKSLKLNLINFKNAQEEIDKGYITSGVDIWGEWIRIKDGSN